MGPILRSSWSRLAASLPALFVLLLAQPRAAGACSVCLAGDPVFSTHGASAQEAGSFSLYLEARSFRKTSGAHAHEEAGHGIEDEHGEEPLPNPHRPASSASRRGDPGAKPSPKSRRPRSGARRAASLRPGRGVARGEAG